MITSSILWNIWNPLCMQLGNIFGSLTDSFLYRSIFSRVHSFGALFSLSILPLFPYRTNKRHLLRARDSCGQQALPICGGNVKKLGENSTLAAVPAARVIIWVKQFKFKSGKARASDQQSEQKICNFELVVCWKNSHRTSPQCYPVIVDTSNTNFAQKCGDWHWFVVKLFINYLFTMHLHVFLAQNLHISGKVLFTFV